MRKIFLSVLMLPFMTNAVPASIAMTSTFDVVAPIVPSTSSLDDVQSGMIIFDVSAGQFKGLDTTGSWQALTPSPASSRAQVYVSTPNGYGSANTAIRRFTNIEVNNGSDITYADSSTLGASFTINSDGVYTINYSDSFPGSSGAQGISVNSASLSTNISTLTYSQGKRAVIGPASGGVLGSANVTLALSAGDIVRAHNSVSPQPNNSTSDSYFNIVKVNN